MVPHVPSGVWDARWRRPGRRRAPSGCAWPCARGAGEVEELELEAHPALTVGDAAAALARELDAPAAETLTLARTGEELAAGLPLLEAGLRDGDELLFGAGTAPRCRHLPSCGSRVARTPDAASR